METSQLSSSITAFKAQTQEAAIAPSSLGTLLQSIVDSLGTAALATDTTALQQWQTNVKGIGSALTSAQVRSNTTTSLVLGFNEASLTSGISKLSSKSVSLPTATYEHAGVMTAEQAVNLTNCVNKTAEITSLRNKLATQQKLVRELGNFGSEEAALEAIGKVEICSDQSFAIVHCTYQTEISLILVQNVVNDYCRQVIFNKDKIFHRAIYFTSSERLAISHTEDWTPLFADRLKWDSDNHKYVPSLFGLTFNKDYTDAIPLATSSQAGLMTADQATLLAGCDKNYTSLQNNYTECELKIPNKATYTAANRRIDVKHGTNVLYSLTLPLATSSVPGLTTTADITSLRNNLATQQKLVRELGNFDSEGAALEAIGKVEVCSDQSFAVVHCTYQMEISLLLIQNVVNDYCRQVIFNKDKVYNRAIYFTSSERTAISYMEDWTPLFADRLKWDADNHKYIPSLFGLTFNKDYTDAIPLATTSQAGLMTADQVQLLNRIENKLNALLGTNS